MLYFWYEEFSAFYYGNWVRTDVEFDSIKHIRPVIIDGTCGERYYIMDVTNVVYTGETTEETQFGLFAPDDCVTYLGKTYKFSDLDRLCMVVENENNLAALETL